jgi:hypothetical protein
MRRIALFAAAAMVASCAAAPAQPPPHGQTPGHECQSAGLANFVGGQATTAVGAEILRVSNAAAVRWVQPGMMVTMEFRADRVTAWLAPGNRIERVNCG